MPKTLGRRLVIFPIFFLTSLGVVGLESLDLLENDKAKFKPQNENEVTYAKKITKEEAKINWNADAKFIIAKINKTYSVGPFVIGDPT